MAFLSRSVVGCVCAVGFGVLATSVASATDRVEFLDCRPTNVGPGAPICDLQTGLARNDLVSAPPGGSLVVLEPDTNVHASEWESAPLAAPITLVPGPVTLDLVLVNMSENSGSNDICWAKHAVLPNGSEIVIVPFHCFENTLPVAGFICPFGAVAPNIPANCLAAAGLQTETVTSSITTKTELPAGTVIELSVACPGNSFLAVFFNNGLDVDGDGVLEFSKITEPQGGGACCDAADLYSCTDNVQEGDCQGPKQEWHKDEACANVDCTENVIPAVTEWGIASLVLLLLAGLTIKFRAALPRRA